MYVPASKGWIDKYFDMVLKGDIQLTFEPPQDVELDHYIHGMLGRTGIMFGYPSELVFTEDLDHSRWTNDEKLKVLLFEAHLFVYQTSCRDSTFEKTDFIDALVQFYGKHQASAVTKIFGFFMKESPAEKLEAALSKRVEIKTGYRGSAIWMNYLSNFFVYIDVLLFKEFLAYRKSTTLVNYDELAMNALVAITLASHSSGDVNQAEQTLFDVFLASANLSGLQREIAIDRYRSGCTFDDFTDKSKGNYLFKRFLLDISALVIFANHEMEDLEKDYLKELCVFLGFSDEEFHMAWILTEQFVLANHAEITFLQDRSNLEKMYGSLSKRWVLILGRNRVKLAKELNESRELVNLIKTSRKRELSKEEKESVKNQFKDLAKSIPSLAIFLLPGGAILLPVVLKVIPGLLPSAFRDNEIEADEMVNENEEE